MKKPKCYNCEHASAGFKIGKVTHHCCGDPEKYNQEKFDKDEFHPFDTIRYFSDTCDNHKFKIKNNERI